ncbi:MAG: DUF4250 domain-containing protein [Bacteroidaceae bacterium]|nr:DUF4250 domain-containing protein [Bacteroidaceae bacterium]
MDYLPNDPAMLVSAINMLLRDEEFETLEELCDNFDRDVEEIKARLLENGYVYNETLHHIQPQLDEE